MGENTSFFSFRVSKEALINAALAAVSGVLASLAFPPYELCPVVCISLVPLFVALRRASSLRASGWLSLLFGIVFLSLTLRWLSSIFGPGIVGVALLGSLPFVLFGLSYRYLSSRSSPIALTLITPVLWLAADWLRCDGWYFRFSWAQLGFSLTACPWGMKLYPLIGVYGATFLIALLNAGIVGVFDPCATRRTRVNCLILPPAVVALCIVAASLVQPPESSRLVVRAVQDETGDIETLKRLTLQAAPQKPSLTVWPEYTVPDYPLSKPHLLADLQQLARKSHSLMIVGCKEHALPNVRCDWFRRRAMGSELFYNTALLIAPSGDVMGTYHKAHPIQLFSDGVPGGAYPIFATPSGKLGVAVCYDFDFASDALALAHNGAELIAVPTFDPTNWGEIQHTQHARMAQARAAEVGRWVVRATSSGVSQIIDTEGHVIAALSGPSSGQITANAGLVTRLTPYTRATFVFPYLCLIGSILAIAYDRLRRLARNSD